jgi:hypothetical protein
MEDLGANPLKASIDTSEAYLMETCLDSLLLIQPSDGGLDAIRQHQGVRNDHWVAGLQHYLPRFLPRIALGASIFEYPASGLEVYHARFSPGPVLAIRSGVGSKAQDATQVRMERRESLEAGVGDDRVGRFVVV